MLFAEIPYWPDIRKVVLTRLGQSYPDNFVEWSYTKFNFKMVLTFHKYTIEPLLFSLGHPYLSTLKMSSPALGMRGVLGYVSNAVLPQLGG